MVQVPGFRFQVSSALSLRFFVFVVHGSKIQNSLHAYIFLLKHPMNKWIDAFASLHKAYIKPTWSLHDAYIQMADKELSEISLSVCKKSS